MAWGPLPEPQPIFSFAIRQTSYLVMLLLRTLLAGSKV
jgi:hypothetical protein